MRVNRNGKQSPRFLSCGRERDQLLGLSSKTAPLNMTTVHHKITKVWELEGPRRASSPAQGQTGFILQAEMSADMPRFQKKTFPPSFLSLFLG